MANDRLYLKCKTCGATRMLVKYYITIRGPWFPDRVRAFLDKHMKCSPNFGEDDLGGDACFTVFAESDERFNELIKTEDSKSA